MESTGRWSNGLGSLNPKCHYNYQEMSGGGGGGGGGGLATLFTPGSTTVICVRPTSRQAVAYTTTLLLSLAWTESTTSVWFKHRNLITLIEPPRDPRLGTSLWCRGGRALTLSGYGRVYSSAPPPPPPHTHTTL